MAGHEKTSSQVEDAWPVPFAYGAAAVVAAPPSFSSLPSCRVEVGCASLDAAREERQVPLQGAQGEVLGQQEEEERSQVPCRNSSESNRVP